jgi:transcriptional regulator with XRE-family HTH domain
MTLKEYLKKEKLSVKKFSKKYNFSSGTLSKWIYGERFPRPDSLIKINRITKGEVTPNDFTQQISGNKN